MNAELNYIAATQQRSDRAPGVRAARCVGAVVLVCCLISAAPNAKPDDFIREGTKLIEKGDFEAALQRFQDAEERSTDPGLIAFDKAAAYWHLGDFRKAENHIRMALDDADAPPERRARAFYNLANCLVKQADDREEPLLRDAIRYYEFGLDLTTDDGLRTDARHNLEVAKLLWNQARARSSNPRSPNSDEPPDTPRQPEPKKKPEVQKKNEPGKIDDGKDPKKEIDPKTKIDKGNEPVEPKTDPNKVDAPPQAGPGRVPVIPDTDLLKPLSIEDTLEALKRAEERLHEIRKRLRGYAAIPEKPSGKDW